MQFYNNKMQPSVAAFRKGQRFFVLQMAVLIVYVFVLITRSNSYSSAVLLTTILTLSILIQKGRPYSPLIIGFIALYDIRVLFGIESWLFFLLELLVFVIALISSLVIRVFVIPNRYGLHQKKFQDQMGDVGFTYRSIGQLPVSIWYPTKNKTYKDASWIAVQENYKLLYQIFYVDPVTRRVFPFWLFKFCISYLSTYKLGVHTGARLQTKDKYKIILFSHGLGSHSRGYNCYCNWWAKRGYIVISVQHEHDVPCIDYRLEKEENKRCDWLYQRRHKQISKRRQEMVSAFKFISNEGLNEIFGDKVQIDSIMFAGHSFGGSTILQVGASILNEPLYQKVSRYLCLDPWLFPLSKQSYKNLQRPILFITSQRFVKVNPAFYELHLKNQTYLDLNPLMSKIYVRGLQHLHPSDTIFTFGTVFVLTHSVREFGKRMLYVEILVYMIRLFEQGKTGQQIIQLVEKQIKLKLPNDQSYLKKDQRLKWED